MKALVRMKAGMGIDIKLLGILFTIVAPGSLYQINRGLRWQKRVIALVREQYSDEVFDMVIKRNTRLAEAPSFSESIFEDASG